MAGGVQILVVGSGAPNLRWGGGARRTYQLLHELKQTFGDDGVAFVERTELDPLPSTFTQWLQRKSHRAVAKITDYVDNPFHLVSTGGFGYGRYLGHVRSRYRSLLARHKDVRVCIFEHLEFAHFSDLNRSLGLTTVLAPW